MKQGMKEEKLRARMDKIIETLKEMKISSGDKIGKKILESAIIRAMFVKDRRIIRDNIKSLEALGYIKSEDYTGERLSSGALVETYIISKVKKCR